MLVSEFLLWDTAHIFFCKEHLRRSAFLSFSFAFQGNGKKRMIICQVIEKLYRSKMVKEDSEKE